MAHSGQAVATKEVGLTTVREIPNPYRIAIEDMVARYEKLYTAAIIDVFQEMGLHNQWLGPQIRCITRDLKREAIAGFAFTVQWISDPMPDERPKPAASMVGAYPRDSIIVVDTGADQVSGFWGELATTTCLRNGVRGAVINGGAKDTGFVREMGFPIFVKFSSPVDGFRYSRLRGWQLPVWLGSVLVRPWDFIIGDADGVLVVPQEVAEEVLLKTEQRRENENKTRSLLKGGLSPVTASEMTGRKDL
jgi:4-hydroxy-4-methyl-2-oxoglutarate aldolase